MGKSFQTIDRIQKEMRILYLFRSLAVYGGIERILVDKMNYLSAISGFEIFMLTTDQGTNSIPYDINNKVHIEDLNICFYRQYKYSFFKRILVFMKMKRIYGQMLKERISRIKPDVIVCTTSDHIDVIVKIKGSIPLVVESHSICSYTIEQGKNRLLRKLYRYHYLHFLSKADYVIALTEGDANEWRKVHDNVLVIPNMVHLSEGRISMQSFKKVIFVGRFDYQKRVQDIIKIWSIIHLKHPDWSLHIYGDGEQRNVISSLVKSVNSVFLHPPTNKIFDCYHQSSIMVSTSLFEPFGLAIAEAMSCGIPVVAFNCPYGPKELITDGINGYLVPCRDIEEFASRVCMLIDNKDLRRVMGQNALKASRKLAAAMVMPMWTSLFYNILHEIQNKTL